VPEALTQWFVVAKNPDESSSLPYLIKLPVRGTEVVLKAREMWPRTARVYCHRAEGWPAQPEIIEEVAIRSCESRGPAIDLVLDRARENRSQLVFTRVKGREAIFWQTARTVKAVRPGIRIPTRRALGLAELRILVDSAEKYPYRFAHHRVATERRSLPVGDYGIEGAAGLVAVVERKTIVDLVARLVDGTISFTIAELSSLPRAAIVVEDRYSRVLKAERVKAGFAADLLARVQARYPRVPIVFCETRPLAEDWTYRFLAAALLEVGATPQES